MFSLVLAVHSVSSRGRRRRLAIIAGVGFLAFGVSDLIEMQTGAWWRPPELLALKAGCLAVFAGAAWKYPRMRESEGS